MSEVCATRFRRPAGKPCTDTDMDIDKTMEFSLEQQADFAPRQATSGQQIETLGQAVRDLLQVATLQSERLDAHDRRLEGRENGARLLNSDSINLWNVS